MDISFKPALLSTLKTWNISGEFLTSPKNKEISLKSVVKAHYIDMPLKAGRWILEFKLQTTEESVSILCNDTQRGQHRQQCFILISEVLKNLQAHNPDLQIRRGYGRIANYAFACIALIPFGFGLSFVLDAIDTFGFFFGGGFMLLGLFLLWCASPWQAPPMVSPQALRNALFRPM